MNPEVVYSVPGRGTNSLAILDVPADVLVLIFSLLRGQDIARCSRVCRCFQDVILSHLNLQYSIELAQNGMVDGDHSGAPMSERLQQLRKYSSNFRNGIFDHEDLAAHPDYVLRMVDLTLNTAIPISSQGSSSVLYGRPASERIQYFLSVFIPGSSFAGIPSSRWVTSFAAPDEPARSVTKYAIDPSQDLLATVEVADIMTFPEHTWQRLIKIFFYSLIGSKAARTAHPAAALPRLEVVLEGGNGRMMQVDQLSISGDHIVWGLGLPHGPRGVHCIEVYNWKTGGMTKRLDFGKRRVRFTLLDEEYLLVSDHRGPPLHIDIYSTSPSMPCRPVCTLELPSLNTGERILSYHWLLHTSEHATTPRGHFRVDPTSSMVVLTLVFAGTSTEGNAASASYFLIPHSTLFARIRAAEIERPALSPRSTADDVSPGPAPVPWSDWGPQGCLRLRAQRTPRGYIHAIPFASRMPLVAFEGPDFTRASVYVFDVNPLVARHARQVLAEAREHGPGERGFTTSVTATAVVEDVEVVLPGVVDASCAEIPFVVYRFALPVGPSEQPYGHVIQSVEMSMTGFTVKFGGVSFEESLQTWTV